MYCQNCGTELPESGVCPNCNPSFPQPKPEKKQEEKPAEKKQKQPFRLNRQTRSYAAILSALLVFPSSLSIAIDLSFHRYDFWFGYVVGALFVVWVCAVLPVLKVFPAPVNAVICFASVLGYTAYVVNKTGHLEWLLQRALPLFVLFAVFVSLDVMLISSKKANALAILSAISFEIGIYLVAIEATYRMSLKTLHWSPILACGFVSVGAVFLAFAYIGKANKKDDR